VESKYRPGYKIYYPYLLSFGRTFSESFNANWVQIKECILCPYDVSMRWVKCQQQQHLPTRSLGRFKRSWRAWSSVTQRARIRVSNTQAEVKVQRDLTDVNGAQPPPRWCHRRVQRDDPFYLTLQRALLWAATSGDWILLLNKAPPCFAQSILAWYNRARTWLITQFCIINFCYKERGKKKIITNPKM
jgi:hypothetical protein